MIGPGKYDLLCTEVRIKTMAEGAIVIVVKGSEGSGFSAQVAPEFMSELPNLLRFMADQIETDNANYDEIKAELGAAQNNQNKLPN